MRQFVTLLLLLLLFQSQSFCQSQFLIDSLKQESTKKHPDTVYCQIYNQLSRLSRDLGNFKTALHYASLAKRKASQIGFRKGEINALDNLSATYRELGNTQAAISNLNQLLVLCKKNNDQITLGNVYDNLGHVYYSLGDTLEALENHQMALTVRQKAGDIYGAGNSCDNIAHIYNAMGKMKKSLYYFGLSLSYFIKERDDSRIALSSGNVGLMNYYIGNRAESLTHFLNAAKYYSKTKNIDGIVWAYHFVGDIHSDIQEFDLAIEYCKKALYIAQREKKQNLIADSYNHLGRIYFVMNDFPKSIEYTQKCIIINEELNNRYSLMEYYYRLGKIYTLQERYADAILYHEKSLEFALEFKDKLYAIHNRYEIGTVLSRIGKPKEAIQHLEKTLKLYHEIENDSELYKVYQELYIAESKLGNYQKALDYYQKWSIEKDKLNNLETEKIAIKHQYEKKVAVEQAKLEKKNEATRAELNRKKFQRNAAIIALVLTSLLVCALLYIFYIREKKLKVDKKLMELVKKEAEATIETASFKSRFITNLSHEIRTPLTLINGQIEILKEDADEHSRKCLIDMEQNSNRILQLINHLLELAKMESGQYTLRYQQGNILNEIQENVQSFHSLSEQKQIKLSSSITPKAYISFSTNTFFYSKEAMTTIINNLISNALKCTKENGEVVINIDEKENQLYLQVSDNGPGIPDELKEKIFDRFYQIESKHYPTYEGSGIGLAIVKELVNLQHGDVWVSDNESGGSVFHVLLSNGENKNTVIYSTEKSTQLRAWPGEKNTHVHSELDNRELPLILLVEDQDELRSLIRENIELEFRVVEAVNGQDGLLLANELIPDIIISDVMMPFMSGIELCTALRKDPATSHIPVILLTAKADKESTIEGLEYGAVDYITKPFSIKEIQLKLRNYIHLREQIHQNLSSHLNAHYGEDLSSTEKEFITRVIDTIQKNISNTNFQVNLLSETVFLSASQLTRKLKAITGKTPADFIKNIRMKEALELLRKNETVNDVAWKVGFENPAYFGKVFKKHYGVSPSDFEKITE